MKILAVIPARGGSKGIKNKNIKKLNGEPLIWYTIKEAKKSKYLDRVVVSTDSRQIAEISKKCGAEVPFLRPPELAQDKSSAMDAVIHLILDLDKKRYKPDAVMLLQPTSPLREVEDINQAVELFKNEQADSLVSICQTENLLFTKDKDDNIKIMNPEFLYTGNRQELPKVYKLDGSMIYLAKTEILLREKSFLAGKLVGYEIPRWRAIDLDEPQDFILAGVVLKNKKAIIQKLKKFK